MQRFESFYSRFWTPDRICQERADDYRGSGWLQSLSPACSKPKVWLEPTLLREEREGKERRQKAILPTSQPAELNTTLTSARFNYQSPGPCLTPCSVNRSLIDLIGPRTRESPAREEAKPDHERKGRFSTRQPACIPHQGGKRGEAKIWNDPGDYLPEEVADSYIASLFPSKAQHEYRHSKKKVEEEMAMYERASSGSL